MASIRFSTSRGEREVALGDATTVGRDGDNDIVLDSDPQVSGRHALVRWLDGGYVLEDLGSRNGTFLERTQDVTQVVGAARLEPGDIIRVGATRLALDLAGPHDSGPDLLRGSVEQSPAPTQTFKPTVRGRVVPFVGPLPAASAPPVAAPDLATRVADLEQRVASLEAQLRTILERRS